MVARVSGRLPRQAGRAALCAHCQRSGNKRQRLHLERLPGTLNNNELVAVYGNFVNRALQLTKKYFDGVVPAAGELNDYDRETLKEFADVKEEVEKLLDVFKFRDAQKEAMNLARIGNKYLADTEPWKLAKTDMPRVATILNISLQLVANLAIAFEPFLPFSSEKLRKMLNMDSFDWAELGHTDLLPAGHQLATPELLFEKIEDDVIQAQVDKLLATKKANEAAGYKANPVKPVISFEDFEKLDIRVGTVLECEAVPKMKKLLKFKNSRRTGKPSYRQRHRPALPTGRAGRQAGTVHRQPDSPPIQERTGERRHDTFCRKL